MSLIFCKLKKLKKYEFCHIFHVVRGWSEKPPTPEKIFFIKKWYWNYYKVFDFCPTRFVLILRQTSSVFWTIGKSSKSEEKFSYQMSEKPPPSKTKEISPKNVYVISLGCLKNVQKCLFLLWAGSIFCELSSKSSELYVSKFNDLRIQKFNDQRSRRSISYTSNITEIKIRQIKDHADQESNNRRSISNWCNSISLFVY